MPDLKISQLPVASATTGAELFPVVQGGVTKQIALNAVRHIGSAVFDANGSMTVDTNTLFVDAVNNRVGVLTATPSHPFQIASSTLIVDTSGNLGLGVTPVYKMDVQTSSERFIVTGGTSTATASAVTTGGSSSGLRVNGFPLTFGGNGVGSAEHARFSSAGNFGIGTVLPANALSVIGKFGIGPADFTATATIHGSEASGADRAIGQFSVFGASNGLQINWNHAASKMHIIINNIPTASAGLPAGTLWSDSGTIKIA